jgi:hypothetical protein
MTETRRCCDNRLGVPVVPLAVILFVPMCLLAAMLDVNLMGRGYEFPAYEADPLAKTLRSVGGITASVEYSRDYAVLERDMGYGQKADFATAISTLKTLAKLVEKEQKKRVLIQASHAGMGHPRTSAA